jgi:hypothetical protein
MTARRRDHLCGKNSYRQGHRKYGYSCAMPPIKLRAAECQSEGFKSFAALAIVACS